MKKHSELFVVLCVFFVAAMLASNIVGVKMAGLGPLVFPVAVVCFPLVYVLSDVFSEVYGYRASRRTAWYAFGANLLLVAVFKVSILFPGAPFWSPEAQGAFESVLGGTWRLLAASLVAYMVGDWLNDILFQKLKERHGRKKFALRAIVSSMLGEAIDSFLFICIAFYGTDLFSFREVPSQWMVKIGYEIVLLPLTILAVKWIRRKEEQNA